MPHILQQIQIIYSSCQKYHSKVSCTNYFAHLSEHFLPFLESNQGVTQKRCWDEVTGTVLL